MNTVNKFVSEISRKLADAIVEATNYKVLYKEAETECKQANDLLAKFNKVLESDQALKELFDEASAKIEEVKVDGI